MKLMILNLNRETNQDELKALFTPHGEVASCDLVLDKETGKSKGFGFVEMSDDAAAEAAIAALHGTKVGNQPLRVKAAGSKE